LEFQNDELGSPKSLNEKNIDEKNGRKNKGIERGNWVRDWVDGCDFLVRSGQMWKGEYGGEVLGACKAVEWGVSFPFLLALVSRCRHIHIHTRLSP
jgi:hypothetical protein